MKVMTWFVVCCGIICITGAGSTYAETDADRLSAEGDKLLKARKFQEALTAYQSALDKDWEHCPALYGMGRALFGTGDYERARKRLEELIAFCPGETRGQLLLGYAQLALGAPREARKIFLKLWEANPRNVSALIGLGYAEYHCGNPLAGEQYLKKALSLQPENRQLRDLVRTMEEDNRERLRAQEAQERQRLVNEFNRAVAEAGRQWSTQAAQETVGNAPWSDEEIYPWLYDDESYWRRRGGSWYGVPWGGAIVGDRRFRYPWHYQGKDFRWRGHRSRQEMRPGRPGTIRPHMQGGIRGR